LGLLILLELSIILLEGLEDDPKEEAGFLASYFSS
jgi:hypothetical protein